MELLRTWILGVTAASMVLAAAQALMPEGPVKRVGRLTAGLILTLALLQPLVSLSGEDLTNLVPDLPTVTGKEEEGGAMQAIIEQELAAYIVDKGRALGADCAASVTCVPDENGVPIPRRAVVTGLLTGEQREALSAAIARDLGIPADAQSFREG